MELWHVLIDGMGSNPSGSLLFVCFYFERVDYADCS